MRQVRGNLPDKEEMMAQTFERAARHRAIPDEEERRSQDTEIYRLLTFTSAVLLGVALAVLWDHRVADPIAMAIQRSVVGTTTPAEIATTVALALVAGVSMVVTA